VVFILHLCPSAVDRGKKQIVYLWSYCILVNYHQAFGHVHSCFSGVTPNTTTCRVIHPPTTFSSEKLTPIHCHWALGHGCSYFRGVTHHTIICHSTQQPANHLCLAEKLTRITMGQYIVRTMCQSQDKLTKLRTAQARDRRDRPSSLPLPSPYPTPSWITT
jgi:hypothetical protein